MTLKDALKKAQTTNLCEGIEDVPLPEEEVPGHPGRASRAGVDHQSLHLDQQRADGLVLNRQLLQVLLRHPLNVVEKVLRKEWRGGHR